MSDQIRDDVKLIMHSILDGDPPSKEHAQAFSRLIAGALIDLHRLADATDLIAKHIRRKGAALLEED